jgi:periplasmic divalent cation tolerance protein
VKGRGMKIFLVISTAGSEKEGWKIAQRLVETKMAACVNVIPKVRSFFRWKGKICQEQEVMLFIKTVQKQLKKINKEIKRIHSYELPEIIFLQIDQGGEEYLQWIKKMAGGGE